MSPCCKHLAAKGEQRRVDRLAEHLVSGRRGATGRRTQKFSNRLSDPDFSTGLTGVLLSGLKRLPEAAAVQEQIDAIIRPGIELSLGSRHTEAEGAALGQ